MTSTETVKERREEGRENNLLSNYVGTQPYSFSSAPRVQQYYPSLSIRDLHQKLSSSLEVYSKFRKKRKSVTNPIFVHHRRHLFQADCIYFTDPKFRRFNKGYKYLLVIIDCFTKFVWVQPLKSLKCSEAIEAFKNVFNKISVPPKLLQTDQGAEFKCEAMKTFLKSKNIFHYYSFGDRKSAFVERVNRSLQNLLYPLMYQRKTKTWIKLLDEVTHIYNHRQHRTIHMSPAEAEQESNQEKLIKIYRKKYKSVKKQRPKFKEDDIVRLQIKTKGGIKRRDYLQSFTDEKYKIAKVIQYLPIPMFKIKKMNGDLVRGGSFYHWELARVTS